LINIAGLAIGIAACLLILLYMQDELSYDTFYPNSERIYRLNEHITMSSAVSHTATVPFPVTPQLLSDFPEIVAGASIFRPASWGGAPVITVEDQEFNEEDILFADAAILDIFNFEFVNGERAAALKGPNDVLLTESAARKYFGNDDPVGKTFRFNNNLDLEVVGVLKDVPHNSHIKFNFLVSLEGLKTLFNNPQFFETNWVWVAAWSYLLLPDRETAESIRRQLPDFVKRHFPQNLQEDDLSLSLQAMTDIHLHSHLEMEFEPNGDILYVYVFSAIAIAILLIACINFMNLATARSAGRAKEVGMRKVMGAFRNMLVKQFLGEALLLSFISLVFAIFLVLAALPWFNTLTGKELEINFLNNWVMLSGLLLIGLFVGVISGSYPAFYLSAFRPAEVLKGSLRQAGGSMVLRKTLVITQFVVSIALLICIGIIYSQLDYLQNKDLGFDREQVLIFNMYGPLFNQFPAFEAELLRDSGVRSVTRLGASLPGAREGIENSFVPEGAAADQNRWIGVMFATHDLLETMGMEMVAGRSFSRDFPTDSSEAWLINDAAAREFGWKEEEALGKTLSRLGTDNQVVKTGKIIGIVKNFHFRSLHLPIRPLIVDFGGNRVAVKVAPENFQSILAHIQNTWDTFVPGWPLNYSFLDQNLGQYYQNEEKISRIVQYFAFFAILIACLGLFGLASFTAERRTKEMGVRKALGASAANLVLLIARDFIKLVGIAFVIATPLAYLAMDSWLSDFAYRTNMGAGIFIMAGLIALAIALLTVSYHALKAAMVNPVQSLRYE
jgi:putative ABC transport system permease protein